eukprot:NODE_165_length_1754_cov_136.505572_g113_i0.p1 GENE.NODE_165_length_1754_cov_136.505572_g113_i0~~NODE_165_length_1754_cov_136.505572_g113_i0.p1  ORF type:complete len:355 (-),score=99.79 NODE_165_length_1754_cov_136.505572_g113_i0:689-1660(-)
MPSLWPLLPGAGHASPFPLPPGVVFTSSNQAAAYLGGGLGALGSLFFIISYLVFRDLRTKSRQLLLFLSLADLGQAVRFLSIGYDHTSEVTCSVQSVLGLWVATASFLWTACISVYVYLVVKNPNRVFPELGICGFHLLAWGYPTAFAAAVVLRDLPITRSSDVPWCFLGPETPVVWRVLGFGLPLVSCWIVTAVMYVLATIEIDRGCHFTPHGSDGTSPFEIEMRELQTKFKLIPLVFVVLRVWDAIYHVYSAVHRGKLMPVGGWYLSLMIFGDASQGFFNCLIFVFLTRKIRQRIASAFCNLFRTGRDGDARSPYFADNNL